MPYPHSTNPIAAIYPPASPQEVEDTPGELLFAPTPPTKQLPPASVFWAEVAVDLWLH